MERKVRYQKMVVVKFAKIRNVFRKIFKTFVLAVIKGLFGFASYFLFCSDSISFTYSL